MDYISQKTRFGSYKDGKYFSGIIEYYWATLAIDVDSDGKPIPPTFSRDNWKNNIQSTKFGSRYENEDDVEDPRNGIVYKYLWNVEEVCTTDSAGNISYTKTSENLLQEYTGGKIPARYISYYAANSEAQVPGTPPSIGTDDGRPAILPGSNHWQLDSDFDKGADADTYLFEITFVEYAPDDEGIITYERIEGPTLIGRNGKDSITLVLDNDSDVIAINANGKIVGQDTNKRKVLVSTTASVVRNGVKENGFNFSLATPTGQQWTERKNGVGHYEFSDGKLEIYDIPSGFSHGNFIISDTAGDLNATFGLRTMTSNVDYNLNITPTVVNNSSSDGTITVNVNKTKEDGTVTTLEGPGSENIEISVDGTPLGTTGGKWNAIKYTKEQTQDIKVILKETLEDDSTFIWDEETIEFVQNGLTAYSLKIVNDKNAFNYTSDNEPYPNQSIEFTLQGSNIDTGEAIWTAKDGDFCYRSGSGNTFNLTPGLLSNQVDQTKHNGINIGRIRFLFSEGGKVFCGDTYNRIYFLNSETGLWEILIGSLSANPLGCAYFDRSYYFITYDQGIYKYNGETVSPIKEPSGNSNNCYEEIIANEEKMIIAGKKDGQHCLWTSDGTLNDSGFINLTASELEGTGAICDICKIDDRTFFAGGQNGYMHLIRDTNNGITTNSQKLTNGDNFTIRTVYYHDGKYFVGYQDETITTGEGADTSLDKNSYIVSLKWNNSKETFEEPNSTNLTPDLGKNGWVRSITYFNGFYYAFCYTSGASAGKIFSSTNGKNWQLMFTGNIKACWCSAIVGNQLYWAGESGTIQKFKGVPNLIVTARVDDLYDKVGISSLVDATSPYVLSLTNDSATIGATTEGEVDDELLKVISTTTAELNYGDIQETNVQFDWSVDNESGTIAVPVDGEIERQGVAITNSPTICFTAMSKETASVTVFAYLVRNNIKADHPIAKKVFTITKNKSGNSAVAYQLNVTPNKVNEADFTGEEYEVQLTVTEHDGKKITNLKEGYSIKVGNEDKRAIDKYKIKKENTTFSLYVDEVFQDSETVEVTPVLYDYKAVVSPSQITAGSFPTSIGFELRQVGKGSSQSVSKKIKYRIGTSGNFIEVKKDGALFETNSFTLSKAEYENEANPFVVEIQYYDGTEWKLFDKVTITVLQDAVTNYTIYHDVWSLGSQQQIPDPEISISDIPTYDEKTGESVSPTYGWYQGIQNSSVYQSIKSCKPSEATTAPWSKQIRLSGVLSTKQDLLNILDSQGTKDDGIYNEDGNILINATAIKAGALKVADDNNNSYFEAGWDSGGMPLVKIGGVDFTGYVPGGQTSNIDLFKHSVSDTAITTRPEGGKYTIGPRMSDSDNSVSFCSYLSYKAINKEIVLQVGEKGKTSFGTDEPYYRFSSPNQSNLYNLKAGRTYILSGEAKLEFPDDETDYSNSSVLFLRNQYYDGSKWADHPKIVACCANEEYRSFSRQFTVPASAKGYYCSFQVMTKDGASIQGNNEKPFKGCFYLKNLKLVEDSALNISGAYSWKFDQDKGLYMWKGAQTTTPVMKVDSGGLELTGKIHAKAGGTIGGWEITENSLTQRDKNSTAANKPAIAFISGTGSQNGSYSVGESGSKQDWLIWVKGDQTDDHSGRFGVDASGAIYATKGKIGGVEIDELVSPDFGRNFLVGGEDEQSSYDKTSQKEYLQTNFDLAPFFDARGLIEVTLSFDCKAAVAGEVLVYAQNGNGAKYSFNKDINIKQANTYSRYSVTFTPQNSLATETRAMLAFYGTYNTGRTIAVKNLKLEIGAQATEWCPSVEETNVSSNNYSWKFSPTEGIKMWNGLQTSDPIFRINNNGLYMKGNGEFTGTIIAEGGNIGGMSVKGNYANLGNIEFKEDSISLSGENSKIELNGLTLKNTDESTSVILGTQKLIVSGAGGNQIVLDNSGKGDKTLTYKLMYTRETVGNNAEKSVLKLVVTGLSSPLGYSNTITIYFTRYRPDANIESNKYYEESYQFTVDANTKINDQLSKDVYANFQDNAPILGGTDYVGFGLSSSAAKSSAETKAHSYKKAYTIGEGYTYTEPNYSTRALFNCHLIPGANGYDFGSRNTDGKGESWRNIYAQNAITTTSWCDIRLKNSIEPMDSRYDTFFDKMEPVRFKYNNGTSNRFHTGFIAQSLVSALEESNLSTQDFAAVVMDEMGTDQAFWYLRREEIVSLNTWQIQKLKPRVSLLEQTIINYESRISHLETEVENLKNS